MSCGCAAEAAPNAVTSRRGIPFCLVNLVHRHKKFSRSDEKIRQAPTELACWAIIVRRGILNIGEGSAGKSSNRCEGKDGFHRHSKPVKRFRTAKAILYFRCSAAPRFCVFIIEIPMVTARIRTMIPSERVLGIGK